MWSPRIYQSQDWEISGEGKLSCLSVVVFRGATGSWPLGFGRASIRCSPYHPQPLHCKRRQPEHYPRVVLSSNLDLSVDIWCIYWGYSLLSTHGGDNRSCSVFQSISKYKWFNFKASLRYTDFKTTFVYILNLNDKTTTLKNQVSVVFLFNSFRSLTLNCVYNSLHIDTIWDYVRDRCTIWEQIKETMYYC